MLGQGRHSSILCFHSFTGAQLYPVLCKLDNSLSDYENHVLHVTECYVHIDNGYDEIVTILRSAAEASIPQHKKFFYKFGWSQELDCVGKLRVSHTTDLYLVIAGLRVEQAMGREGGCSPRF